MARRKLPPNEADQQLITPKRSFNLFAQHNRGLLLDIVVFIANLFLMRLFTGFVIDLFNLANNNNSLAKFALISGALAMWILPAAGSVMKRWHFHQRLAHEKKSLAFDDKLSGCLFNPIFYFCLNLVVMSAIVAALGQELVGKKGMDSGAVFVPTIFIGLAATIFQTYLIYRYFIPPKKPPKSAFLRRPESELLGDVCFFFNMLMFQAAWNLLTFADLGKVSGIGEFLGRLFFLSFVALLIYFPPRMFYLAEDINRPRTWLTMLLANSPVIFKVLVGTKSTVGW